MPYALQLKDTTTFANQSKSNVSGTTVGSPIGLLLALTYGSDVQVVYTKQTKNTNTFSLQTKNNA